MGQARSRYPRRTEIEIRHLFEVEHFGPGEALGRARENSRTEEMKREQSTTSGWYTQRGVRLDLGRKARKMGHQRTPLCGLGGLPPQGITCGPGSTVCVAVQRLVRA